MLGSHDDGTEIQEGMEGSRADIADFSVNNNSVKFDKDEKMIELLENLNKTLSNFNKEQTPVQTQSKEGGTNNKMTKFEELLAKYGKTAEDVTFDYAEMSDEELEAKFAEMFDGNNSEGDDSDNGESGEPSNDGEGDGEGASDPDGDEGKNISKNELFNKLFEISFDEIRYALNNLCSVYRNDSEWCYVSQVYENYFIMEDWDSDKYYKQSYEKDGDNISLSGERIEMFAMLLTESEKLSIEDMRSNYSALKEFKETAEKNELHAQKEAIINADNYSVLTEKDSDGNYVNADFAELVKTMDNYSVEDFETKVKVMHSDYMSAHANFSSVDTKKNTNSVKILTNMNKKSKPKKNYGNLFD